MIISNHTFRINELYQALVLRPIFIDPFSLIGWFSSLGRLTFRRRNRLLCVLGLIAFLFFAVMIISNMTVGPEIVPDNDPAIAARLRAIADNM